MDFQNTEVAFSYKSDSDLLFSRRMFMLLGLPFLKTLGTTAANLALKLHLPVKFMIRSSIFPLFCGGETLEETTSKIDILQKFSVGVCLDYGVEGCQEESSFDATKDQVIRSVRFASKRNGITSVPIKLTGIVRKDLLEKVSAKKNLSDSEKAQWERACKRLDDLCLEVSNTNLVFYIDAEESWIQPAIDDLSEQMMAKYNKERAVVYTTMQFYRWDRVDYLKSQIDRAREKRYFFGIKLVRGAYMETENELAQKGGYRTPIQPSKEATDRDYNRGLELCVQNIDIVSFVNANHNEESTLHLIELMKNAKIENHDRRVEFSQLYGMGDNISFALAAAGYRVTKYLPYGPVERIVPYLIRRADENSSIGGEMSRALKLINQEAKRRNLI